MRSRRLRISPGCRIPRRRGSLRRPAGFHRRRELRPAFRQEIAFPLRLPGRASFWRDGSFRLGWRRCSALFLLSRGRSVRRPASGRHAGGRFQLRLSSLCLGHRLEFPFHPGELLRPLLQSSLELTDLLPQRLKVHSEINDAPAHPILILSTSSFFSDHEPSGQHLL